MANLSINPWAKRLPSRRGASREKNNFSVCDEEPAFLSSGLVIRNQVIHSKTVPDAERHSDVIATRHTCEKKAWDSLVCLLCRISFLYRSWRVAGSRIVSSVNYLHHQCADWVFLCLESLETREARQTRCFLKTLCRIWPLRVMDIVHAPHGPDSCARISRHR